MTAKSHARPLKTNEALPARGSLVSIRFTLGIRLTPALTGITERTVKAHLASIYQKLNVDSRAAAVAVAAQKGLLAE